MALGFQGSSGADYIDFGNLGSFDPDPSTWLGWFNLKSTGVTQTLMNKGDDGAPFRRMELVLVAGSQLRVTITGQANLIYESNTGVLPTLPAWVFCGFSVDTSLGNDLKVVIYLGDLTTTVAAETLNVTTEGNNPHTFTSENFKIGNSAIGGDQELDGDAAYVGVFPSVLSLAEMRQLQYNPRIWGRFVPELFTIPGFNGLTNSPDFSGFQRNGTLSGNVTLENHIPLPSPFAMSSASSGVPLPFAVFANRMLLLGVGV